MQNYYRVLGVSPSATIREIERAYGHQRARLKRLVTRDRAFKTRLDELEVGFAILGHPRRRQAYDVLLAQQPPPPAHLAGAPDDFPLAARIGRSLNAALLACCLLLALDWGLPLRQYRHETVRSRFPVAVAAPLSDPQMAYRVHTQHTSFRLPSNSRFRVRSGQRIVVWQTPLLGVVARVQVPDSPTPAPFRPYGGTIYGTVALLPLLLGGVAAVGVWPGRPAETVVNTAVVSALLALLAVAVLLIF